MRTCSSLLLIGILFLMIGATSCAKHINDPAGGEHLISYTLSASNYQPFSSINYTDSVGMQGSASAADSTSFWTKTIATSIKPFSAELETQGINNTSGTVSYTLSIYVDGVVQSTKQDSVLKFSSFDTKISAEIQ